MDRRKLKDLVGIGGAMLGDFEVLGIRTVDELSSQDADQLYARLSEITGRKQDICVLDVFRCAIAQARDPELPEELCQWWWWSRQRRAGQIAHGASS